MCAANCATMSTCTNAPQISTEAKRMTRKANSGPTRGTARLLAAFNSTASPRRCARALISDCQKAVRLSTRSPFEPVHLDRPFRGAGQCRQQARVVVVHKGPELGGVVGCLRI